MHDNPAADQRKYSTKCLSKYKYSATKSSRLEQKKCDWAALESVTSRCCSVRFCRPRDAQGKVLKPAKNCTQGTDYDLNVWAGMPGATAVANRGAARTDIKACGCTPPSGATTMHAIMPCLLYWRHLPGSCLRGLHRCIILSLYCHRCIISCERQSVPASVTQVLLIDVNNDNHLE